MNQLISKGILLAMSAFLIVSVPVFAQKQKEKNKDEKTRQEEQEMQHITITRNGDTKEKLVIEIHGDQVKINGKDARDIKDVHVNINNMTSLDVMHRNTPQGNNWNFDFNEGNGMSLFREDANRAMLGIVTEGNEKGAEVMSVTRESAAEKAGLKKGDILTKIGDRKIESTDDVTESVHLHHPGEKIGITFLRDGKEQNATAELGKWKGIKMNAVTMPKIQGMDEQWKNLGEQWKGMAPSEPPMNFDRMGEFFPAMRPRLGLSIQDTDDGAGVKVLNVDEESNAAKAGIKEGDIITAVNDHEVKSTDDVTKAMREKDKNSFNFRLKRDGKTQNIEVKIPRRLKTADL